MSEKAKTLLGLVAVLAMSSAFIARAQLRVPLKQVARTASDSDEGDGGRCVHGGTRFQDTCYIFSNEKRSWLQAKNICLAKSADLVQVTSEDVSNFLQSFLQNVTNNQQKDVWIGLHDIVQEGSFEWAPSRTPVSFTAWAPGEPSNHQGLENCVAIRKEDFKTWNDLMCSRKMLFICQIR